MTDVPTPLLDRVKLPADLKALSDRELHQLADELRTVGTTWSREPLLVASTYAPEHATVAVGSLGDSMPFADLVPAVSLAVREQATKDDK